MRWLLTTALFLGPVMSLRAGTFIYVSMTPEEKIPIYRLDPGEGKLTGVDAVAVEGAPGALAIDPGKKFLLAARKKGRACRPHG
jgi:6-phosphogluconolactonase (cycloisomerase 2 family)